MMSEEISGCVEVRGRIVSHVGIIAVMESKHGPSVIGTLGTGSRNRVLRVSWLSLGLPVSTQVKGVARARGCLCCEGEIEIRWNNCVRIGA